MLHNSSVTQYVLKNYTRNNTTMEAAKNAALLENRASEEMEKGILSISIILPNIKEYISPTLQVIYDMQNTIGDINLKKDNCK